MTYAEFVLEFKKAIVFDDKEYAQLLLDDSNQSEYLHSLLVHINLNISTDMYHEVLKPYLTDKQACNIKTIYIDPFFEPGKQVDQVLPHLSIPDPSDELEGPTGPKGHPGPVGWSGPMSKSVSVGRSLGPTGTIGPSGPPLTKASLKEAFDKHKPFVTTIPKIINPSPLPHHDDKMHFSNDFAFVE